MKNQTSINHLLDQVEELIQTIKTDKKPPSPSFNPQNSNVEIEVLKINLKALNDVQTDSFNAAGADFDQLVKETLDSSTIDEKDKEWLLRAKKLEDETRLLELAFAKAKEKGKKEKRGKTSSGGKQQIRERRKLFKTLGGDKKWIPL